MNPLLLVGLIGTSILGSSFVADLAALTYGNREIHWTHQQMRLPLQALQSSAELYLDGQPLTQLLEQGRLLLRQPDGSTQSIGGDGISVRVNNWPTVRAGILSRAVWGGFGTGIAVTLLAMGISHSLRRQPLDDNHPARRSADR